MRRIPGRARFPKRGFTALSVILVLAAMSAGICSITFTIETRPHDTGMVTAFWLSLALAALCFAYEAHRDSHGAAMLAVVILSVTAMVTGAVAWFGEERHLVAATVAVASLLGTVANTVLLIRNQLGKADDPMRRRFAASSISELDGIQFVAKTLTTAPGEVTIEVVAENCWSTERQLTFGLECKRADALSFDAQATMTLAPASLSQLFIPVRGKPGAAGDFELVARPSVAGRGGTRVKRWHAKTYQQAVTPGFQLLALLGGVIIWGGGMRFRLHLDNC